jgi:cytochrome bd ubiquinol oxidase subunit II
MATVWFVLILFSLAMYVVLDGYDLGVGVGSLFERDPVRRRLMLEQVAVAWDGNESWLVLFVVALWAGFPLAFGTLLPQAYPAVIVLLLSLIARGISIEMVSQAPPAPRWQQAFGIGSLVAALAQGAAIGTVTADIAVVNGAFSGAPLGAFGPFSILTAVSVTVGYVALGYAYLKWKSKGDLRAEAGRRGLVATIAASALAIACLVAVNGTAAPLNLDDAVRQVGFAALLLIAAVGVALALATLRPASTWDGLPIAGLVATTLALLVAIAAARYPVLAPPSLTIDAAVSPESTMTFLAVGVGVNIPLLLFYNWFAHHEFRGKMESSSERQDVFRAPVGDPR